MNERDLNFLLEHAKKDPCWRLYNKTVEVDILKNIIKNFKL